jgi:hypothetical protein
LLLGIADFVVMTETRTAFVTGPTMVAEFTGVRIDNDELGGAASHARYTGATSLVAPDLDAAIDMVAQLLAYLPQHNDEEPPRWGPPTIRRTADARGRRTDAADLDRQLRRARGDQSNRRRRRVARATWSWASERRHSVRRDRRSAVGIVANQPLALAGTLDIPASQKAARFVAFCDAFNLPIVTLVDTARLYPGKDLEWRGMIRHGAQLVFAYGRATVPRICVILRKSYGGAYIVMDSKRMGNDLCLAWPWAELAVMGAGQAAAILQRRATADERAAFELDYAERLLNPVHRRRSRLHRRRDRTRRDPTGHRRGPRHPHRQTRSTGLAPPRQHASLSGGLVVRSLRSLSPRAACGSSLALPSPPPPAIALTTHARMRGRSRQTLSQNPVAPSVNSRRMSRWPACLAVSRFMWNTIHRNDTIRRSRAARR